MIRKLLFIVIGLQFMSASIASASCGLHGCSLMDHHNNAEKQNSHAKSAGGNLMFSAASTYGSTSLFGESATYLISQLSSEYMPKPWLRARVSLPYTVASLPDREVAGLSDVLIDLSIAPLRSEDLRMILWLGLQSEFPTGSEEDHLGSGHYGMLPYLTGFFHLGNMMGYFQTGIRFAVSHEEHADESIDAHAEGAVFDPHSNSELLYRSGVIFPFTQSMHGKLSVNGQTVLSREDQGKSYLTLLPEFSYKLNRSLVAEIKVELPITTTQRLDWRSGISLSWLI